ncbi:DUF3313 family protein [Pelagicoccus mobilis]|uniref:DUF3313 family protein n=1 Tax=Pelagicoccus mobilis TaxID=415221 RepID=A0A934VQT7_9BACT|nr:DUF3313 family protein [Pelagicoccus mobilis]MBK1876844.1 DUF3313 family protein [Pelagicoccus mobilis]
MKPTSAFPKLLIILLAASFNTSSTDAGSRMPDVTTEGLVKVKGDGKMDYVYVRQGSDFSPYTKVIIDTPDIAFRSSWQQTMNSQRGIDRISESDMQKMIKTGKKLLLEEFNKEVEKVGIEIVENASANALLVRAKITDLNINAPDPNQTAGTWTKVYAESAGDATLTIELYDSVTMQLLARAIDRKIDIGETFGWQRKRDHYSNIQDAREALNDWARSLAFGLNRTISSNLQSSTK